MLGQREGDAVKKVLHALKWVIYDFLIILLAFVTISVVEGLVLGTDDPGVFTRMILLFGVFVGIPYRFCKKLTIPSIPTNTVMEVMGFKQLSKWALVCPGNSRSARERLARRTVRAASLLSLPQ